jgi:D-serine deaminase-like pyridoxal phosphate-dependent protein
MVEMGINKIKCATLAEAEMAAQAGIDDILIAYQLTPVQIPRLIMLIEKWGDKSRFSVLLDNILSTQHLLEGLRGLKKNRPGIYLDLNIGQNRCGNSARELKTLIPLIQQEKNPLILRGLHAYDGHIHDSELSLRKEKAQDCVELIHKALTLLNWENDHMKEVIVGGSPAFQIYGETTEWDLSPGTIALWDYHYAQAYPDLPFEPAALLMGRIISTPVAGQVTADLGTKALSCDGPIPGVVINEKLNLTHKSQSEEHWILKSSHEPRVGEKIFALPYHICPTVALYDEACAFEDGLITSWPIIRSRKMNLEWEN